MSHPTESSSLLERRRQSKPHYYTSDMSVPLPSPSPNITKEDTNGRGEHTKYHKFRLFNKRSGLYDEDRQSLVKESTGVRVWNESYSSIGKVYFY